MGGGGDRKLARACPKRLPGLRRGIPRRADGPGGCGRASGCRSGGSEHAGNRTGDRPERTRRAPLVIDHPSGAEGICRPRSDGADWRTRHARKPAGVADLAARFAAVIRFQSRGAHAGCLAPRRGSDGQPASRRPASLRERGGRVRRRPTPQRRSARSALRARTLLRAAWPVRGCRGCNTRPRCV